MHCIVGCMQRVRGISCVARAESVSPSQPSATDGASARTEATKSTAVCPPRCHVSCIELLITFILFISGKVVHVNERYTDRTERAKTQTENSQAESSVSFKH